jgi:hypothetical protein
VNNEKFSYEQFFKTDKVSKMADLIITKIEETGVYYVHKN